MPEVASIIGVQQDAVWHPEGDVFKHTKLAMDAAVHIADKNGVEREFAVTAAMLHDIGKPETTVVEDGRIKSPGHARVGAEKAHKLLSRILAPHDLRDKIVEVVDKHMGFIGVTVSSRFVRRLMRRLNITLKELATIVEADHSARPPIPGGLPASMVKVMEIAKELDVENGFKPLIMGRHLIAMGMTPGPEFGPILEAAAKAQVEGKFDTVKGGKEWVAQNFIMSA